MGKLPSKNNKPQSQQQITVSQSSFYAGKLPSPEMFIQYNLVEPGFANRILKMSEEEQVHNHKIENKQLSMSVFMALIGMLAGLSAMGVLCYLLYLSIVRNNTEIALAIVAIMAGIVGIFVLKKKIHS